MNIAKKILNFNNQQKYEKFKIFIAKKILQRLPITVAQVTAADILKNH